MEDIQLPCEESPGLGKSFSFYSPSDNGLTSLSNKRPDHVDLNMFAESLPLPAFQKGENLKGFSSHPCDVSRKIDAYFEDFSMNSTTPYGSNGNIDSIITSMNHLGLTSASADHLPAEISKIDSFRNIWKNDCEVNGLQSFSQHSANQTLTDQVIHPASMSYSVSALQQQQQKYLYNLMALKNSRTMSNAVNGNYDLPQRAWDENLHRLGQSKSFPSLLNSQFARQNVQAQHSSVDMPHIVLKSRSNMPFPKHLLPYTVNGMRNVLANVEDEDQHGFSSTSLDQDLTPESLNSSLFNNGWIHSNTLTRVPHNEVDLNHQMRDQVVPSVLSASHLLRMNSIHQRMEQYSRKVFVGGLPPDIDDREIMASFERFGSLVVDWPHKAEMRSYFPPKGYCFLLFQDEMSVKLLIESCILDEGKLYCHVSSPTIRNKLVQIRPWKLMDSDFVMDNSQPLDPRKTIFVGGVPRPLKAAELAQIIDRLYGGVCYAGIDVDPDLKYPKGAGRVAFSNQQSYIAAISARFVQLQHGDIDKRVEVKPYVLDDQLCDECQGVHSVEKFAPYFCANVTCLQYYCEKCWYIIHSRPGREFHKPLIKEGADRPRVLPFRW